MKFLFLVNFEQVSEIKIYEVAVIFAIISADNLGAAPYPLPCWPPSAMPE